MINRIKSAIVAILLALPMLSYSQQGSTLTSSLDYLKKTFPKLTNLYSSELSNCHTHYIFAVDVSLSMAKYESTVLPALKAFVAALPNGDRMTVIPFAKEAYDNKLGFDVKITNETRATMLQTLNALYPHDLSSEEKIPYMHTDIAEVQKSIMRSIQQSADFDVDIVIYITDMMHCPAKNIDRQFDKKEVKDIESLMKAACPDNAQVRLFALQLPKAGKPEGYVMPKMKELYLQNWGDNAKLEVVDVPANSDAVIAQWFDLQKNRIMFTKLQAIIERENKANPIEVKTEIDIDGNITANINWKAGKLYKQIKIDTIFVRKGSDFQIFCNDEYMKQIYEGELHLEGAKMGILEHNDWFFHQLQDTLYFNVLLPVDYQHELDKLLEGRPSPTANAAEYKDMLIWTFIFPFWLTATLIVLFVIWFFGFIKAIARNNRTIFIGTVEVYKGAKCVIPEVSIRKKTTILVGNNGNSDCDVDNVDWQVSVTKENGNPLWWGKPKFKWKQKSASVRKGKSTSGYLKPFSSKNNERSVTLSCGPSYDEETHTVDIILAKKSKY